MKVRHSEFELTALQDSVNCAEEVLVLKGKEILNRQGLRIFQPASTILAQICSTKMLQLFKKGSFKYVNL